MSRLKISLWAAQGDRSICPVMEAPSPESSGGLYLLVRMFPLLLSRLHSSHVSVIEVCPAARLHVRRILSLSIKWTLDPPTHRWKRQLHNNTRISGVQEIYSPPQTSSWCSVLSLSLSLSLFYPFPQTHIFSSLGSSWKRTFGLEHTNPGSHTQQRLLFNSPCSSTHSCLRIFPIRILAEVNTLRYWHIRADSGRSLLPLWRNALCQSTLGNSSMVAL